MELEYAIFTKRSAWLIFPVPLALGGILGGGNGPADIFLPYKAIFQRIMRTFVPH